jgi:REP element-mobilizing transposase RayT
MANTYTQLYIQIIFAVKGKQNLIPRFHNNELQKYVTGIVQNRNHKMLAVNNEPDHVHIFLGLDPKMAISILAKAIKSISSKFINEKRWFKGRFEWQKGYGAFSYSRSQIDRVIKYINNQQEHHRKKTFREEYLAFLKKFKIEYNEKYLFDWIE